MAIYHLSGSIIARSQGRSAVACAAYRAGEKLYDARYEKFQDYTKKKDVVFKEILAPQNAPDWMLDREKLWNAVEAIERRKDAQLSREFNLSLPKELTLTQNLDLAKSFIEEQFVSKGMVADLCVHADKNQEGQWLYHCHIMLTLRELTDNGFGKKVRAWNEKSKLLEWREAWAEIANKHLVLNGHDLRIDHRSLEAQEIPLEPQSKIGPAQAWNQSSRLEEHQRIARENGERLFEFPAIALNALTQQQSTFTHQDLARFVNRHTVDAEQFERVYDKVKNAENIVSLGLDEQKRERFTTQEMLELETELLNRSKALAITESHPVLHDKAAASLGSRNLSPQQKEVFDYLLAPQSLRSVVGYAGTGKSYLLGAAREAWESSGYQVKGATLSGIAAQNLEGSSGIGSRTLASWLYRWDRGEAWLGEKDILVVDEAGMLGSRQMARVVHEIEKNGAKLVLVGDIQQLQAIQAGAAFRAIVEQTGFVELTEVRRQRVIWQQEATQAFARGEVGAALERYQEASHLHEYSTQSLAQQGLVSLWNDVRLSNPTQTQIILAYTRAEVQVLNEEVRNLRKVQGELGKEASFMTVRGEKPFAENDRVYFLKNDRDLGVMNGSLGTIAEISKGELLVWLDKGEKKPRLIAVNVGLYNHLDHGYAATLYKAQGVTVDRSYLLGSKYFDAHSAYVGMSRHRESVDLFWSREEFPRYQSLVNTLSRDRSKDISLDYGTQFEAGSSRGFEHKPSKDFEEHVQQGSSIHTQPFKVNQDVVLSNDDLFLQKREQLREFKARFESLHPEEAKRLQYEILPSSQKEALQERQKEQTLQEQKLTREPERARGVQELEQTKAMEREKTLDRQISKDFEIGGFER